MCKQCNTEFNPTTHFQMLHFLKLARFLFISRAIWYFTSESILLINILTLSLDKIDRFEITVFVKSPGTFAAYRL